MGMDMVWRGVMPAVTTPFNSDLSVDHDFLAKHLNWLADHGSKGIVALGSLGEAATLTFDEKTDILKSCVKSVGGRIPIIAGISALSTKEAVDLAQRGLGGAPGRGQRGEREQQRHERAEVEA